MIGPRTQLLLTVASDPLGRQSAQTVPTGPVFDDLRDLLEHRNGFYAFEGALHLFGAGADVAGRSLEDWNSATGWRAAYAGLADDFFFFAEDGFGVQFGVRDEHIWTFDPETGDAERMASSIEAWADQVLLSYKVLTGFPVVHAWQEEHGAIALGERLVPKVPFVLGGAFDASNLYALDAVEGMRVRADLAVQIRDTPDGARVRYTVVE